MGNVAMHRLLEGGETTMISKRTLIGMLVGMGMVAPFHSASAASQLVLAVPGSPPASTPVAQTISFSQINASRGDQQFSAKFEAQVAMLQDLHAALRDPIFLGLIANPDIEHVDRIDPIANTLALEFEQDVSSVKVRLDRLVFEIAGLRDGPILCGKIEFTARVSLFASAAYAANDGRLLSFTPTAHAEVLSSRCTRTLGGYSLTSLGAGFEGRVAQALTSAASRIQIGDLDTVFDVANVVNLVPVQATSGAGLTALLVATDVLNRRSVNKGLKVRFALAETTKDITVTASQIEPTIFADKFSATQMRIVVAAPNAQQYSIFYRLPHWSNWLPLITTTGNSLLLPLRPSGTEFLAVAENRTFTGLRSFPAFTTLIVQGSGGGGSRQ